MIGNPIEGATVEVLVAEGGPMWRGVTNATGDFGTNNLSRGTYVVEVAARGFHKEGHTVILKETDALRLDIGLIVGELTYVPPIEVSGVVRDHNGKLLSGATVTARAVLNSRVTETVKTNAQGRYSLLISKPGRYEIVFLANGRSSTVLAVLGEPWDSQTLDVSLH